MGDSLKPPFLYELPVGMLLVVGLRGKWRSSFSRTCIYSVCECTRQRKIIIFVRTFYGEVVGTRVKAKMAIEFFPWMLIQRITVWETT